MGFFNNIFGNFKQNAKETLTSPADKAKMIHGLFGNSKTGTKAAQFTPDYLQNAAGQGGNPMAAFFGQAFKDLLNPQGLNQQLGILAQGTEQRARKARSAGKFKGSPVGEALAGGIESAGAATANQARTNERNRILREGLGLTQGFTGAVTNPLMNILGLTLGNQQQQAGLAESRRQFDEAQPSELEKVLGFASGIFCWVARATLQDDRWLAAREYLIHEAPDYTKQLYLNHGEELAEKVKTDPAIRAELTPVFEEFARRGAKYLE